MTAKMTRRKGQSAIEYLMTYGWMLLVVAIVGGAIFATVRSQGCNPQVPMSLDAQQQGFGVTQFGDNPSNVQVVLKNNGQDSATVNNVTVNAAGTVGFSGTPASNTLNAGDTLTIDIGSGASFSEAESCNPTMIEINYDRGGLTDQTMSGNVSAGLS